MWGNLNQQTPPFENRWVTSQPVTVVGPRHPLCDRALPSVGIANKSRRGEPDIWCMPRRFVT